MPSPTPAQRALIGQAMLVTADKIYREVYRQGTFDDSFYDCALAVCDLAHYWAWRTGRPADGLRVIEDFKSLAQEWYEEDSREAGNG